LPQADDKPALYTVEGGVLSLSGLALQEFLRAVLARGLPFRFGARGASMDPFIRDGDVVTIVPGNARRPRLGDVVACCHPREGHLVVHRVIGTVPHGVVVKGDANEVLDGVVAVGDVLGVVSSVRREGHRVVIGTGPERWLLGHLSRLGVLRLMVMRARALAHRVNATLGRTGSARGGDTRG